MTPPNVLFRAAEVENRGEIGREECRFLLGSPNLAFSIALSIVYLYMFTESYMVCRLSSAEVQSIESLFDLHPNSGASFHTENTVTHFRGVGSISVRSAMLFTNGNDEAACQVDLLHQI